MKLMRYLPILFSLLYVQPSLAYFSLMDSGDILAEGQYTLTTEAQLVTSGDDGLNIRAHLDQGYDPSSQFRFSLGTGTNAYQAGFLYKWVPIPDYENQPAVGFIAGVTMAENSSDTVLALQLKALTSKNFVTPYGYVSPYGGLSLAIEVTNALNGNPAQLILGSRYQAENWSRSFLMAEFGFEIADAFSYLSVGLQYDFNENALPKIKKR
ncbi:MAG: hypothetical protein VX642_08705 [Bdellovibrionota bacterium]|nr:hypothetical protein [Bdellovibrionota bacterium]